MSMAESWSKRRAGVLINYTLLLVTLILSVAGRWYDWPLGITVAFWISVALVIATFFLLHMRTALWRLAHAKAETLDERELQETLRSLRHAYVAFSIIALVIVLISVIIGSGNQTERLVVFWILLYLAHTLPSSILAWTAPRVPAQAEDA